jgi:hypothetical protein
MKLSREVDAALSSTRLDLAYFEIADGFPHSNTTKAIKGMGTHSMRKFLASSSRIARKDGPSLPRI